ncbi:putative eukaryotic ribosome biogenesis protein 1 protein [Phaeoacremonium minimum UCRPA7]|uniref:Ribosome biogenesis protein ERB1 n=1 Tax=Phaeoacremonium minimum (strain UCR-PA7) TaxID=1286976 RepID=R8BY55_PHAM7|nr:putative eukaryotic ribosome biogenesis protein 1 protein [Phaeoacremonium minimum UCRPA7]EOO04326.1 putative eukaryotic ribosome biogenesis protein 1 protein [Phaeoacremonium minimum UCRPA7]
MPERKRKASSEEDVEVSDDEIIDGLLDGALSQSESEDDSDAASSDEEEVGFDSEDEEEGENGLDDDEALHSDDIPSDDETDPAKVKPLAPGQLPGLDPPQVEAEEIEGPNYRVVTDANGGVRYEYDEIDPVYDSDDSDAQGPANTIGDIPLSFYDSYPHIGYDINGKKIMRPATGEALDALLDSIEVPKGWTGLTDPATGKPLNLSQDELELLRRVQMNEVPEEGYDPYPDTVEWFTSFEEKMPLSAAPEPKRRFLPSKHEQKRIMKLVRAIREGRILPYKPPEEREKEEEEKEEVHYDIWQDEQPREPHVMHIPAPKLSAPGYDLSYNPPPEYLPTKEERDAWESTDPEEREKEYLPKQFDSLRKVPGYDMFVKERFERCLDLYLAPRVRKNRLNIDPSSLLPKLPKPEELKPFPTVCQTIFRGHEGRVRTLAIDPTGSWLATGGDDGTVRVWELLTGRQVWSVKLNSEEAVDVVRWRPTKDSFIVAAAAAEEVYLIVPPVVDPELERVSREVVDAGFGYAASGKAQSTTVENKEPAAKWTRPGSRLEDEGVLLKITVRSPVKVISWHRRGDHFCTVSPTGQRSAVAIHTLSKHLSQIPFRKLSGLAQTAHFHPSRPLFFVATQRTIRCYDLQKLELVKVIQPGAKAIRAVKYHKGGLPLFADASDDGSLQIFHGKVVSDLMENPTIVPVKMLKGHKVVNHLGVMDVDWHPREAWCVSAGSDGTCRLWM